MTSVLSNIKVIEMGHFVAVPGAGVMLADWGADVIKVEPLTGDVQRYQFPVKQDGTPDLESVNIRFVVHNRNKKGVAINLSKKDGRDILYKLIESADVFISNYELGSLQKFGLDYGSLSKLNPRLVYGILTGYGTRGPDKNERGFDLTAAWARTGFQHILTEGDAPPPIAPVAVMDRVAGINMAAGILAALLGRERSGKGQQIEISLYQTGVWVLAGDLQLALADYKPMYSDRTARVNPLVNTYRTKDNKWIQLSMAQFHLHWHDICQVIGQADLESDPRFPPEQPAVLVKNRRELIQILDEAFAKKTLDQWIKLLLKHNCIFSRIYTPEEVVKDPQAIANDFFIEDAGMGNSKLINTPVRFVDDPVIVKTTAPEVGQNTEEILLEFGYSWEDIAGLKEAGVIL